MMDKILIIDGMNAIHRANISFGSKMHGLCEGGFGCKHKTTELHCACGNLWDSMKVKCSKDVPQEITIAYNFFRSLRVHVEQFKPHKVFFVLEGHPEHRHNIYPQYKANRRIIKTGSAKEEQNDVIMKASELILSLLQYLPITIIHHPKFESDDVIGTLAENLKAEDVTIISNDGDFIQLLQKGYKNVKLFNPIKKEFVKPPDYPHIIFKILNGDKSDNIQTLLTPAKALKVTNDLKLLDNFLSIEENRANFNINKVLIEIVMVPEDELIIKEGLKDFNALKESFNALGFDTIVEEKYWNNFSQSFDSIKF